MSNKKAPYNTGRPSQADLAATILGAAVVGTDAIFDIQGQQGQQDLAESDTLPKQGLKGVAEACGIIVGEDVPGDRLFTFVTLPIGWKKRPTSHYMWNDLVDERDRVRARFFYKPEFYDRDAHIDVVGRFHIRQSYDDADRDVIVTFIQDVEREIFRTARVPRGELVTREDHDKQEQIRTTQKEECKQWLAEKGFPDYEDPSKYWD